MWCDSDALCLSSQSMSSLPPTTTCATTSFVDTCTAASESNYFSDPLFGAANWIFDIINVKPVWKSGISK